MAVATLLGEKPQKKRRSHQAAPPVVNQLERAVSLEGVQVARRLSRSPSHHDREASITTNDEKARLNALHRPKLLDTEPIEAFDCFTRMASLLFDLPVAAISPTEKDRQWFKSRVGIPHDLIPRDRAPRTEIAATGIVLVIPDLRADPCYWTSHLCRSGIRFYVGASLITKKGFRLAAFCVPGVEPGQITNPELALLNDMAAIVMAEIKRISGMPNRTQFIEDLRDLAKDRPDREYRLAVVIDLASPDQFSSITRVIGSTYIDNMVREVDSTIGAAIGTHRQDVPRRRDPICPSCAARDSRKRL